MTEKPLRPPPSDKSIGRSGGGHVVYRPPVEPAHKCDLPMKHRVWSTERTFQGIPTTYEWVPGRVTADGALAADARPTEPLGAVWLCDCGEAWVVRDTTPNWDGYVGGRRLDWVRAGWWTRRKARKAARP